MLTRFTMPTRVRRAIPARFSERLVGGGPELPPLFFLHIPKCGGTSVANALQRVFADSAGGRDGIRRLGARTSRDASTAAGVSTTELREHLLLYWMADPQVRFITGHFDFSQRAMDAFGDNFRAITVLRDPVERWISAYFFRHYRRDDPMPLEGSLKDFVETPEAAAWGQMYLRKLVPYADDWNDDRTLKLALERLEQFAIVGTTERLDDFQIDVEALCGAKLRIPVLNRSPVGERDEVTEHVRSRIRELCEADRVIFAAAAKHHSRTSPSRRVSG